MAKFIPKVIPEPTWANDKEPCTQIKLSLTFQWYNDHKDSKDARKYLLEYLKSTSQITPLQIEAAQYLNNSWNIVDGWVARCLSRGAKLTPDTLERFNDRVVEFKKRLDAIASERTLDAPKQKDENVVSIQERVQNKVDYFIMELEAKFDELWHQSSEEDFVPYTWMVENGVKPMHATKIGEYFRERAKAWVRMIDARKTDEYVKESYPRSHKEYCHGANILVMFATDAEKLAANKNAARKPRKKKPVSFEKKVARLKFKIEDIDSKLVSINPTKILGAQKLWIYNTKYRKLGVYVAADAAGLDVKGSSIENFKTSESVCKTLRKPTEVLNRVLNGGKVVLRKVMDEVNSKPVELNGRLNKETVLLRVE